MNLDGEVPGGAMTRKEYLGLLAFGSTSVATIGIKGGLLEEYESFELDTTTDSEVLKYSDGEVSRYLQIERVDPSGEAELNSYLDHSLDNSTTIRVGESSVDNIDDRFLSPVDARVLQIEHYGKGEGSMTIEVRSELNPNILEPEKSSEI